MSIDRAQTDTDAYIAKGFLKPSHRTRPEQLVGLGIYLAVCIGFQLICRLDTTLIGTLYSVSLGFSMWCLWRRYSLRVLKLELSLFLAQFLFQVTWSVSFFILHQTLLALVALLLLWSNTLVATLLFWKKENISGWLLLFPLLWIFYLGGVSMVTCILNP